MVHHVDSVLTFLVVPQVRPILAVDFQKALPQVKASVSLQDLDVYLDWNKQYGSWELWPQQI